MRSESLSRSALLKLAATAGLGAAGFLSTGFGPGWCKHHFCPTTSTTTTTGAETVSIDASAYPTLKAVTNFVATTFQWRQCDTNGTNCADIAGETKATYLVPNTFAGTLRVVADGITSGSWSLVPATILGSSLPARMIDSTGGTTTDVSSLSAFNTAWNTAGPGDTIRIRAGSYGSLWQFGIGTQNTHKVQISDANLAAFGPVTIENYPGENVLFTGNGTTNAGVWYFNDCKGVRVRKNPAGGKFEVTPGSAAATSCLHFEGCWDCEADGLVGHDSAGVLFTCGASSSAGATYGYGKNCQMWNLLGYNWSLGNTTNQSHAIYYGSHHVGSSPDGTYYGVIANCNFYAGTGGYGLHTGDSAHYLICANNTIDGAPYGGGIIWTQGTTTDPTHDVLYVNNLFTNCGALTSAGLNGTGARDTGSIGPGNVVRNCMGFGNQTTTDFSHASANLTIGTNYHNDPLYVSAGTGNYQLTSSSPAKALADPAYTPSLDRNGTPRSTTPALGAYA